ncbi:helix-turn-helix transcriptional regulator [Isoalcanivorax beigongshangi]|uniref:LuxR C-terminal-related transcriptional regulator n=1 Tax=Isoalcanivorax beigongshangi TaxID=3238810 RepID=A0ABV4AET9_9GAMM
MLCPSPHSVLDGAITRQRLLTALAPERPLRLRLLCAPAGFGKTVLAHQFAQLGHAPSVVWVALPRQPLSAAQLAARLGEALCLPQDDDGASLASALAARTDTLVVLDGYCRDHDSDAWLLEQVQHGSIQWLVTTRSQPQWPLSRLLLDGQLLQLGSEALALTVTEVGELLAAVAPRQNFCARRLHEQSDGWAAGLRLFLYAQTGRELLAHTQLHRCPQLLDYLDQEVLAPLAPNSQQLLQVIAHAPFVDSALCAFLSGEARALQELLAQQAFLRTLPGSTERFTLYEPLRSVLRERYPHQEDALLAGAGWLALAGRHLSAFGYALGVPDAPRAVRALAQVPLHKLFSEHNLSPLLAGLRQLQVDDFAGQPAALRIATRALVMGGRLELAERYLDAFPDSGWDGTRLALQTEVALHRGQAQEACNLGLQALAALEQDEDWTQMILCFSSMTRAELALGRHEQAQRLQVQGLELARRKGELLLECQMLLDQAQVEELAGHLHRALQALDQIVALIGQGGGSALLRGAEQIRRGWLLMMIGDDAAARPALEQGRELSMAAGTPVFFYSYVLLAQLDARAGDVDRAQQRLAEVQRAMHTRDVSESIYRSVLSVGSAGVWLQARHYLPVTQMLERMRRQYEDAVALTPPSSCPELFALMSFLHAQALCSQGAIDEAIEVLTQALERAEGAGFQVIVSQALTALGKARHQRGDIRQAERMLASAAAMAARQGQRNLVLETQLNAVHEFSERALPKPDSSAQNAPPERAEALLSQREHEVLELIAKGYSNAEIADILSISLHTVKAHAKRINAKFQVNRRTLAVARAKALGLLM